MESGSAFEADSPVQLPLGAELIDYIQEFLWTMRPQPLVDGNSCRLDDKHAGRLVARVLDAPFEMHDLRSCTPLHGDIDNVAALRDRALHLIDAVGKFSVGHGAVPGDEVAVMVPAVVAVIFQM